jgi:histone-lysine N-methyltransferase SETMAR
MVGTTLYVGVLISLRLSKGIFTLQDNAAPHKAAITHQKLANLHFEVLKHPAYSPDVAHSEYYIFPNLIIKPKTYQPPPRISGHLNPSLHCTS